MKHDFYEVMAFWINQNMLMNNFEFENEEDIGKIQEVISNLATKAQEETKEEDLAIVEAQKLI